MKKGLSFSNNIINYNAYDENVIGRYKHCMSFSLKLSEVKYIVISPRLAFDDETIFLSFVTADKKYTPFQKKFFFPKNLI